MRSFVLFFFLFITTNASGLEKVSVQLQWLDQFQFAGYYMAKEKGFYEEVGLDVELKKFHTGVVPVDEVLNHRATYGIGRSSLISDISHGKKIKLIYVTFQASPLVFIAKKDSNISTIKDFVGKNVMTTSNLPSSAPINAMTSKFNLSLDDMHILKDKFSIDQFVKSKIDLMTVYISNEPYILQNRGVEINIFDPKEYGFDFYSDILFTSDEELQTHHDRVSRMKEASLRGWRYAFDHIEESVDLIYKKYNPEHKCKEALLYEARELKKLAYYKTKNLGEIKHNKIQRIYDVYNIMGVVKQPIDIEKIIYKKHSSVALTQEEQRYLEKKKSVTVCVKRGWLPYEDIKDGKFIGFSADYLRLISEKLSIDLEIKGFQTQSEVMKYLKKGECDIKPLLAQEVNFIPYISTDKILKDSIVLVTRIEEPFRNNLIDLKETIVMLKGFYKLLKTITNEEYKSANIIVVKDIHTALEMVNKGKAYGYVGTSLVSAYNIQKDYIGKLKILNDFKMLELGIGVNKKDKLLLSILNKTIAQIELKESSAIQNRWLTIRVESHRDYTMLLYVVSGLIVVLLIVSYFLNKQNRLNKKLVKLETSLRETNESLELKVAQALEKNNLQHKQLLQQSRLAQMGEMISMIAHQWRQPLGAIASTTGDMSLKIQLQTFALDTKESKEECEHYFLRQAKKIESYVFNLSNVIDDFRNFYKPNKQSVEITFKEIVEKSLSIIKSSLESDLIEISYEYNSEETIKMYDSEMMQVVLNILKNAQDNFNEKDIKDRKISIKTDAKSLTICDNGGGIDEDIFEKIFDPYFSTKNEKNGTGLGLYMSKTIVEEHHNGKLNVTNTEDGICFEIAL